MSSLSDKIKEQYLSISFSEYKNLTDWPDYIIEDQINKQQNIDTIAESTDTLEDTVKKNTNDISINTINISQNSEEIGVNAINISENTENIDINATSLESHENSNSAHGVNGNNIGTADFAQTTVGGAVLLAEKVADAVESVVSVTSPDAPTAQGNYSQADTQTTADLVNELKSDVNQLVTDVNLMIVQLNALLLAEQNAKQMSTV